MSEINREALREALKKAIREQLIKNLNKKFEILLDDKGDKIYINELDIKYKEIPEILGYLISELSEAIYEIYKPENLSS